MQQAMTSSEILAAWESGARRVPLDRALAILRASCASECDPADLPLAERDRLLLELRAATFGSMLPVRATCPDCNADMEADLDARAIAAMLPRDSGSESVRAMTSRDLAAVTQAPCGDIMALLRKRLASKEKADPDALDAAIESEAAASEVLAELICAACGGRWSEFLDVPACIWLEVERAAAGILSDIGRLAAAFGWTEGEVLALRPERRCAYLAMLAPS